MSLRGCHSSLLMVCVLSIGMLSRGGILPGPFYPRLLPLLARDSDLGVISAFATASPCSSLICQLDRLLIPFVARVGFHMREMSCLLARASSSSLLALAASAICFVSR